MNFGLVLYPTLSTGGRCIALSTPNGVGNWFHKTYTEAEENKNDFIQLNYPGKSIPSETRTGLKKRHEICLGEKLLKSLNVTLMHLGKPLFMVTT